MGWASAGEIFDATASVVLKKYRAGNIDFHQSVEILATLAGSLKDGDWDTEDESVTPPKGKVDAPKFKVKPPKKLYRGVSESGVGAGVYSLGKGMYSTNSKKFASKFGGQVVEVSVEDYFPRDPLVLTNLSGGAQGAFTDWLLRESGLRNIREFNAKYPDAGEFVREKGYDGVLAGDEVVRYPTEEDDR